MPGILHYVQVSVSTAYLYHQIDSLSRYTPVVYGREPAGRFAYRHFYPDRDHKPEQLKQIVKAYEIKAIHAHFGHHGEKAVPLAQELNLPLVTSLRGGEASNHPAKIAGNKQRYANLIRHGSLFLPVCRQFVPWLVRLGFPAEKIKVLYGGIDLSLFRYLPRRRKTGEPLRLICVGKTAPKKGYRYVLQALALLRKHLNAELTIVSQKNKNKAARREKMKLFGMTKGLKLHRRVNFVFDLTEEEIVEQLHRSHIFIQPSITAADGNIEGIPNAAKEAMATGMPVIATRHAGIPELVEHRKNGILVKEKSYLQIADAVAFYARNPSAWAEFGARARQKVEQDFNLEKQLPFQEHLYDQLLGI